MYQQQSFIYFLEYIEKIFPIFMLHNKCTVLKTPLKHKIQHIYFFLMTTFVMFLS